MDRIQQLTIGLCNQLLLNKHNLIGIEIGSYYGHSAQAFINTNAFDKLYCIDPFKSNYDPNDIIKGNLTRVEKIFDNRFKNQKRIIKIKKFSNDASTLFQNQSIDFIYIDGCHKYENVKEDLINYFPKIKKGGIIAGHDYDIKYKYNHIKGVKIAIDQFFKNPPLKIFEDMSWYYIKQ